MLTAQMKNQDPLNPIDSSEYAAQLASFSSVEQQVRTNELLTGLSAQMNVMGMSQLAGWVGMEARSTAPVHFSGSPVALDLTPMPVAEKSLLTVRNSAGEIVQRTILPKGAQEMDWAGVDESGRPFSPGLYVFDVEHYNGDDMLRIDPVETYGRVTEARTIGGQTVLILQGGAEIAASAVSGLRAPG